MQSQQMFPMVFTVKNVTGGKAILSGFAVQVLASVSDHKFTDGISYPQNYVVVSAPQHNTDTYKGVVDIDMYTVQLSNAYKIDHMSLVDGLKTDMSKQIEDGVEIPFAINKTNLSFKTLQLIYLKIAALHPEQLSPKTLKFAISQLDNMIAEEHPCLGLDDIGMLLSNDELSTVATWQLVTANAFAAEFDEHDGSTITRVASQVGSIYSSDVYSAVFDIMAWDQMNERISKAIMFGNLQEAVVTIGKAFTSMLDGIVNDAERLYIAQNVHAVINQYIGELNGTIQRTTVITVDEPEADVDHGILQNMHRDGIFTTAEHSGEYILKWSGLPNNPITPFQNAILTHISERIRLYGDMRTVVGLIGAEYIENISVDAINKIIAKTWGLNLSTIPVDGNKHAMVFKYLLNVLNSSNYNIVDDQTHQQLNAIVAQQLASLEDLRLCTPSFLYVLFSAPADTRFTNMYCNGEVYTTLPADPVSPSEPQQ